MKYSATIEVTGDADKIYKCFMAENQLKDTRSTFKIKKQGDKLNFIITAKDSVALRATLNSIAKLLTVYEKVKNGKGN